MDKLAPSMRPKVKSDTFFLSDPSGGVYFRNNTGSFQIEGKGIDQWIEKLLPVFNGDHTLEDVTEGLPEQYRERIYEIAELLYRNGFVRDVSQDHPHKLTDAIVKKYASQIEFINSFTDSGTFRFQMYRGLNVLTIGSGHFLVSLVTSLLESGLPKLHIFDTEQAKSTQEKIIQLANHARQTDDEVQIESLDFTFPSNHASSWRKVIGAFDAVLYVSEAENTEQLRLLEAICRKEKKLFIPAIFIQQVGMAGPIVHADSTCGWNSAWRRMHEAAIRSDTRFHVISTTAEAMLANVMVFELLKSVTGVKKMERERNHSVYLLNLETMEGNWHSFLPHPLEDGLDVDGLSTSSSSQQLNTRSIQTENRLHTTINPLDHRLVTQSLTYQIEAPSQHSTSNENNSLLPFFDKLTSEETGIFHTWEEGDFIQLPLAVCRVQAVDPLSEGPAKLLSAIICSDLTHEEARKEAGLAGIEAYVARLSEIFMIHSTNSIQAEKPAPSVQSVQFFQSVQSEFAQQNCASEGQKTQKFIGVGAGQTVTEGVCRGLQKCLFETLKRQPLHPLPSVHWVHAYEIEDERCQFYLQALKTQIEEPKIWFGNNVFGFPVAWIDTEEGLYGSVGLNVTLALRNILQYLLVKRQIDTSSEQQAQQAQIATQAVHIPLFNRIQVDDAAVRDTIFIPSVTMLSQTEILKNAIDTLKQNGKELVVMDLEWEPFLKEELAGIFGVLLQGEESV